ncbi:MAG: glycosyltransferase family 2 protein [Deltaproteobacteria bacterium]|nr:MAG: glycosyltransferase family 2 protein [Deltaproteobacteria bacterium]
MTPVSVVIPTLNGGAAFRACLEAIHRQQLDRPFEVICIDSGSTDATRRTCREFGVRLLDREGPFNHGLTRNQAIAAAEGELVALLTQDALPLGTDWLRHLVEALESTPEAAGAYGRQVIRDVTNPYQRWRLESWAATRTTRCVQRITDLTAFEASSPLEKLAVVAFDDVNSCIRKSVWREIPFSAVDFGEDVDWGLRVLRAGYAIVYEPAARVLHSHDDSLWVDFKRVYADHRNLNRLLGMRQIPTLRHVLRCTVSGVGHLWRSVPLADQAPARRLYWRLYAIAWTLVQNTAQYLGARASERAARSV